MIREYGANQPALVAAHTRAKNHTLVCKMTMFVILHET
jgi:hypothetical protein